MREGERERERESGLSVCRRPLTYFYQFMVYSNNITIRQIVFFSATSSRNKNEKYFRSNNSKIYELQPFASLNDIFCLPRINFGQSPTRADRSASFFIVRPNIPCTYEYTLILSLVDAMAQKIHFRLIVPHDNPHPILK